MADEPDRMAKARAAKQAKADDMKATLTAFMDKVSAALESQNQKIADLQKPARLPTVGAPSENLQRFLAGMKLGEMRGGIAGVQDANPNATRTGFQARDIVALKSDSAKDKAFRAGAARQNVQLAPDSPIYGQVLQYLYTSKKGPRKYKVEFQNFGKDGVTEDELVLVQATA